MHPFGPDQSTIQSPMLRMLINGGGSVAAVVLIGISWPFFAVGHVALRLIRRKGFFNPEYVGGSTSWIPQLGKESFQRIPRFPECAESGLPPLVVSIQVGETAYAHPFSIAMDDEGKFWLDGYATASLEPDGNHTMRFENREDGYHVWANDTASKTTHPLELPGVTPVVELHRVEWAPEESNASDD